MADSILKLKVESSEYDAKLKKAAEGIRHLADVAHKGGGDLTGLEKAELDYIKALGDMETKSRSASGQVRELSGTYKELKVIYDQLNEVEKADEGGKALAASLETLRTRAQEAKAQLDTATQSLQSNGEAGQGTSGILEVLKDKFTVNIDAVKLFNMGLQAAEAALNVAKDAFFNNEEQLDEWGRVVESSHSLYTGFLNALNTGDISGYLSNINQIVQAARDAYDALDNLGTYNAFNQINIERTRTNMTESIADYRGGKGSKDTVKAAGEAYKKELQDRKRLENEAYLAAVKRVAAERGVSAKDLTDALSGTYGHYQDLKNVQPTGVRRTVVGSGMFARTGTETFAQTRQEKLGEALRHLNDTELQSLQALGAQAQRTGTEIAQVDKQLTRVLNGRQPGASGGSGGTTGGRGGGGNKEVSIPTFDDFFKQIAKVDVEKLKPEDVVASQSVWKEFADGIRKSFDIGGDDTIQTFDGIKDSMDRLIITSESYKKAQEDIAKEEDARITRQKQLKEAQNLGAQAAINFGAALAGMEDPAAKAAGTVMQAIASIALGFAQASATASELGPFGWVAFLAAGAAAMATTISTVHSLTGYANGGVIKGNSYSGDNIGGMVDGGAGGFVGLNAGEVVLNAAQQRGVASALNEGGNRRIEVFGRLSGETIFLSSDRYTRRTGRGTILTWK